MRRHEVGMEKGGCGGKPGPATDLSVQLTPDGGRGTATNATQVAVELQAAMQAEASAAKTVLMSQSAHSMSQCA